MVASGGVCLFLLRLAPTRLRVKKPSRTGIHHLVRCGQPISTVNRARHGLIRFSFHLESFYLKSDSCVRGSELSVSRVPETNVSQARGAVAFGPPRAHGGVDLIRRRRVFFPSRPYLSFNLWAYGNMPLPMRP